MARCGLLLLILLVTANIYGGYSQRLDGPFCHYDADGNLIWCEKSRRSLNKDTSSGSIVGGRDADILEHPYMLALEIVGRFKCGASVIGSTWAVTAAHCVPPADVLPYLKLRALSNELERGGITFQVSEAIPHPEYQKSSEEIDYPIEDIALLRVTESFFETDSRITAINLPRPNEELPVGTMVTVLGWGLTKEDGETSDHLQSVNIPITSYEHCNSKHDGDINNGSMICAGTEEGGKDACEGDSGGPLVYDNTLYGIVSFGKGCALAGVPGVYTKVSAYREWIKEMTGV